MEEIIIINKILKKRIGVIFFNTKDECLKYIDEHQKYSNKYLYYTLDRYKKVTKTGIPV